MHNMTLISLFCSGGIGDLAARANNIEVLVANEILHDRCEVFKKNFPNADLIEGDVWLKKDEIIETTKQKLKGKQLDFILEILDVLLSRIPSRSSKTNSLSALLSKITSFR